MGGIKLHPEVEALGEDSIETAAIANRMRRALTEAASHQVVIQQWLQELNPHKLSGPELIKWAREVSSYVLPIPLRFPNAIEARLIEAGHQPEHSDGSKSRQASEASSSYRPLESGEVEIPTSRR